MDPQREAEKACRSWRELLGLTTAGSLRDGIKELNCTFQGSCWRLVPPIRLVITLRCPGTFQVDEIDVSSKKAGLRSGIRVRINELRKNNRSSL